MFAVVLVIIQFLILIFIGGFARTTTTFSGSSYYLGTNILFLLAWTLMNTPFKKLTLHSLTILLLTIALTFECNLLFGRFWYSVFNQFSTSYELTLQAIIESSISIFVVLLVAIDYIGIFRYWQIYMLLVPILNFGWSFAYAVLRYGLKIFDGGMANGFLYSGVTAIMIWIVSVRARHDKFGCYGHAQGNSLMRPEIYVREPYYNGYSISLFGGLIGTFFLWPSVNSSLSLASGSLSIVHANIKNSIIFQNTAYSNTILGLCVGTVSSFMLLNREIGERKHKIRCTVDCFINAGIICAYFVDIALNPAAAMAMSLISTIITLILYLYYQSIEAQPNKLENVSNFMIMLLYFARALFRIVLPLLGAIVAAIVVANREYSTVLLLDTATNGTTFYSKTAGLEIAGYFVTLGISILGGLLCGLTINLFHYIKQGGLDQKKAQDEVVVQSKLSPMANQARDTQLGFTKPQSKISQNPGQLIRSRRTKKQKSLSDLDFLELGQDAENIFPLFLEPQDKYFDEQETARKMLKEAILSHVKNNYISTNNYISVNKNKNVNTNNTFSGKKPDDDPPAPDPKRKLNFDLEKQEHVLKNETRAKLRQEYSNNIGSSTPKSMTSQIKNQSKEIVEHVNKELSAKRERGESKEAMPEFYVQHIRGSNMDGRSRGRSITSKNKPEDTKMNRSKTEKYLTGEPFSGNSQIKANKNMHLSGIEVLSKNSEGQEPPIKKTTSVIFPPTKNETNQRVGAFNVISELKEEEEYRSRNVEQQRKSLMRIPEKQPKQDKQPSFIMEQNQHQTEVFQNSQVI